MKPDRYLVSVGKYEFRDENTLEAVATTGRINRLDEILPADALRLDNYRNNPVVLWSHDWEKPPIGKTIELNIKGGALKFAVEFAPTDEAMRIKELYRLGFLNAWSVGFTIFNFERETVKDQAIRRITDAELLEISSVVVPADAGALSSRKNSPELCFRSLGDVITLENAALLGAIPYKETPKADEAVEWDASAEIREADVDDLKMMCAWFDSEYPNIKQSYKLPHHKHESPYPVVWRAVATAGAVVMGARGGVDIPDSDIPAVKSHLEKHYHQFDKVAPWEAQTALSPDDKLRQDIQHLAKELRQGRRHSETDMAMLRDIIVKASALLATTQQDDVVDAIVFLTDYLGKNESSDVVFDALGKHLGGKLVVRGLNLQRLDKPARHILKARGS